MARELGSFDDAEKVLKKAERKYPWVDWTNGSSWAVTHGEDFACGVPTFIAILRKQAKKQGQRVRLRKGLDHRGKATVVFQFYES